MRRSIQAASAARQRLAQCNRAQTRPYSAESDYTTPQSSSGAPASSSSSTSSSSHTPSASSRQFAQVIVESLKSYDRVTNQRNSNNTKPNTKPSDASRITALFGGPPRPSNASASNQNRVQWSPSSAAPPSHENPSTADIAKSLGLSFSKSSSSSSTEPPSSFSSFTFPRRDRPDNRQASATGLPVTSLGELPLDSSRHSHRPHHSHNRSRTRHESSSPPSPAFLIDTSSPVIPTRVGDRLIQSRGIIYRNPIETTSASEAELLANSRVRSENSYRAHQNRLAATGATSSSSFPRSSSKSQFRDPKSRTMTSAFGPEQIQLPEEFEFLDVASLNRGSISPSTPSPPIPQLTHGLQHVIHNPGAHYVRDPLSSSFNFDPFLFSVHQPDDIDYDALPEFITTSKDYTLRKLADAHNCKFTGSTSSVSGLLSHCYFMLAHWRSCNPSILPSFADANREFSKGTRKPAIVVLRPSDGVTCIDSDPGMFKPANEMLLSLGKSMEKMMVLGRQEFESRYLKSLVGSQDWAPLPADAYNYMRAGPLLLRSQLDCYDPSLPPESGGVFDLKTRGTFSIRIKSANPSDGSAFLLSPERHLNPTGPRCSFEREFYDMMRSVFLKYSFQMRIGNMCGLFITYHNGENVLGLEYLRRHEVDACLFGSVDPEASANALFDSSLAAVSRILEQVSADFPGQTVKLTLDSVRSSRKMLVYAEPLAEDDGWAPGVLERGSSSRMASVMEECIARGPGAVKRYVCLMETALNGKQVLTPYTFRAGDSLDTYMSLKEDTTAPESAIREDYLTALTRVHLFGSNNNAPPPSISEEEMAHRGGRQRNNRSSDALSL